VNVLVFVSDALRADHLRCYGARFVNTSTVDELAASGLRFDQAIAAAPWTAPSMTSMVTGRYPYRHGYLHWDGTLAPGTRTVFDSFAQAGHEVASFVFDRTFLFRDLPSARVAGETHTLDGVIEWLREHRGRPFFLFVHSWATHMPRHVPHGERAEWREAKLRYLACIQDGTAAGLEACYEEYREGVERMSETLVAALLEELDALGLRDSTAVAFLSDHGESWGERFTDAGDVKGIYHLHGETLYDEILNVPLILSAPGLAPRAVRSQVSSVDLVPTLCELAGVAAPECDGTSMLRYAAADGPDEPAFAATSDRGVLSQAAVRLPPWKLVRHLADGREEGYRLDLDPRERTDRAAEAPAELRALLDRELEGVEQAEMTPDEEAIVIARLESLGYL
jgi:arylsulfatase A-like enzyme